MVASTRVQKLLRRYKLAIAAALTILLIQGLVVWSLRSLEEGEAERKFRRSKLPDHNNQDLKRDPEAWERQNALSGGYNSRWKQGLERAAVTRALRKGAKRRAKTSLKDNGVMAQVAGAPADGVAPYDPSSSRNFTDLRTGEGGKIPLVVPGEPGSVEGAPQIPNSDFVPKCDISGKDALSALHRATSRQCRQELANIVCQHQAGELMPQALPQFCPQHGGSFTLVYTGRSNYLHREVLQMAELYPNVRATPWRMVTIWGGASLLKAYLRSMQDLLSMLEWKWDFFINLSATDFPTRSLLQQNKYILFSINITVQNLVGSCKPIGSRNGICIHFSTSNHNQIHSIWMERFIWMGVLLNDENVLSVCTVLFTPQQQLTRPTFFARKFESTVNQEAIDILDTHLYGHYPPGTLALKAYWESLFEREDGVGTLSDVALTAYSSFFRLGLRSQESAHASSEACRFEAVGYPVSVHVYFYDDRFQGYLIRQEVQSVVSGGREMLEVWAVPQATLQLESNLHEFERLKNLEVGTEWDPKERIFRNFGGVMGPLDEPVAVQKWARGPNLTATIVWIDPAQVVAASYDISVDVEAEFTQYKPPLQHPLRPGVWTVRVLRLWERVAESRFLVMPLAFKGREPLRKEEHSWLHAGPPGNLYMEQGFQQLAHVLKLPPMEPALQEAQKKASLLGKDLEVWVDSLVGGFWVTGDICSSQLSLCPTVALCAKTTWSSLSPDPKSELGPVKSNGRIR
uniref:Xylosyltransferase 2 n=1 Tax=Astyanax mexicanus TaxID=7994 RepID=A0A8B9KCG7_ASTMX